MRTISKLQLMTMIDSRAPNNPCSCRVCTDMCKRPCWPTPVEAERIIAAGYGAKLMLDWWVGDGPDGDDIMLLCGANPGYEGKKAPGFSCLESGCVLQANGLCILHEPKLKPAEGRIASCKSTHKTNLHEMVAMTWNTEKGREVVASWRKEYER
jgi:hypothetical protein